MLNCSRNRKSSFKMNNAAVFEQRETLPVELKAKYEQLKLVIAGFDSALIAFSGGIDSTLVTKVALDVLGAERVLAAIAVSSSLGEEEERLALNTLIEIGLPYIKIETKEVEDSRYAANPINRCYFCKEHVYSALVSAARERELDIVLDGFNAEDTMDFRPGRK